MKFSRVLSSCCSALLSVCILASVCFALQPLPREQMEQLRREGRLDEWNAVVREKGIHSYAPHLVEKIKPKLQKLKNDSLPPAQKLDPSALSSAAVPSDSVAVVSPQAVPGAWNHGIPTTGTIRAITLLIEFPDYPHITSRDIVESRLFGDGNPADMPFDSLRNYYRRSSYYLGSSTGEVLSGLNVTGTVADWYMAPKNRDEYMQLNDSDIYVLVREAMLAFVASHPGLDFNQFDANGDGVIDALYVVYTGPQEFKNEWWGWTIDYSHIENKNPNDRNEFFGTLNGKKIKSFSWQWETEWNMDTPRKPDPYGFRPITAIHEMGHILGLPDLYGDFGGAGWNLDIMDGGVSDHNSFSKFMLGWIDIPGLVGSGTETLFPTGISSTNTARIIFPGSTADPGPFGEFFLIENRWRVGNDVQNPGDGLLIWHIDSTLNAQLADPNSNFLYQNLNPPRQRADSSLCIRPDPNAKPPVTGDPDFDNLSVCKPRKLVRLMEADGLEEVEKGLVGANASDYYGVGGHFGRNTVPNSSRYWNSPTGVSVENIKFGGDYFPITFDYFFDETKVIFYSIFRPLLCEALRNCKIPWTTSGAAPWNANNYVISADLESTARSGVIADNQASYLESVITGPATLTFRWKVSSELECDFLVFSIDGIGKAAISGEAGWEQKSFAIPEGTHTIQWKYEKDISKAVGSDAGWVDAVVVTAAPLSPPTAPVGPKITSELSYQVTWGAPFPGNFRYELEEATNQLFTDSKLLYSGDKTAYSIKNQPRGTYYYRVRAFRGSMQDAPPSAWAVSPNPVLVSSIGLAAGNGNIPWQTHSNGWFAIADQTSPDGASLVSGSPDESGVTWVEATVLGPGTVQYGMRIMGDGVQNQMRFLIDGVVQESTTAGGPWQPFSHKIDTPGTHILRWEYVEKVAGHLLPYMAFLDSVTWNHTTPPATGYGNDLAGGVDNPNLTFTTFPDHPWKVTTSYAHQGGDALVSANLIGQESTASKIAESWVETTVSGQGVLRFYWANNGGDKFHLYVDGKAITSIPAWKWEYRLVEYRIDGPAAHTVRWTYRKDVASSGYYSDGKPVDDRGHLDQISWTPKLQLPEVPTVPAKSNNGTYFVFLTDLNNPQGVTYELQESQDPMFKTGVIQAYTGTSLQIPLMGRTNGTYYYRVRAANYPGHASSSSDWRYAANPCQVFLLSDALDTTAVTFVNSIIYSDWFGQTAVTHDGVDAARSGPVGSFQKSTLEGQVSGQGMLSFWWKVSSELVNDYLSFTVDGVEQFRISGEVDWQQKSVAVTGTGPHSFVWSYAKDLFYTGGMDAGFLDQVVWTPACASPGVLQVPATNYTGSYLVKWGLSPTAGCSYEVQESTDPNFGVRGTRTVVPGRFDEVGTITITGRATGVTYYYRVRASKTSYTPSVWVNGTNSCLVALTTVAAPGTPQLPAFTLTGGYPVTWDASDTTGATYELQRAADAAFTTPLTVYSGTTATLTSFSVTGQPVGTTWYYRVRALKTGLITSAWVTGTNGCSSQVPDTTPNPLTFPAKTGVPLNSAVLSDQATVSGINTSAPITVNGGMYVLNGGTPLSTPGTVVSGDKVAFQVQSSGLYATSRTATITIGGVVTPFSVTTMADIPPAAPTGVTAAAGNVSVKISFTAPVANGGSPVTLYTATAMPGGKTGTCAPDKTFIIIDGLTAGSPYTVTVTATNAAGTGPASVGVGVTPFADGVCGGAAGGSYLVAPIHNLCASPSVVAALPSGAGPWIWVCKGAGSGSTDNYCLADTRTGSVTYTPADLTGTWEMNAIASGPDAPWWGRGSLTVAADGSFTGNLVTSDGHTDTPTGTITVTSDGTVTIAPQKTTMRCRMDAARSVITCTSSWSATPGGTTELALLVKKAAHYTQADLTGVWEMNGMAAPGTWWERGPVTISADGLTTAALTGRDGSNATVTGAMTMTAGGLVSVTSSTMSATEQASNRCVMDAVKSMMVCTSTKSPGGNAVMYLYTRRDTGYPAADSVGIWNLSSLTAPASAWRRGMMLFDANGSFTGSLVRSDGTVQSFTDSYSFSGTDGTLTFVIDPTLRCTMDSARRVIVCTGDSGASDAELFVMTSSAAAVEGACGSSNGVRLTAPPADNLCAAGSTPSAVSSTEPWTWTCQGDHGGSKVPCATLPLNQDYTLTVTFATASTPLGGGMVLFNPAPVVGSATCTGNPCARDYPQSTPVVLTAKGDGNSLLSTWSGACTVEPCSVTMSANRSVMATFVYVKPAMIVETAKLYDTLQLAYNAALTGQTVKAREFTFAEDLTLGEAKGVTIKGGFDTKYNTQIGYSLLKGKLIVGKGSLVTERLVVK